MLRNSSLLILLVALACSTREDRAQKEAVAAFEQLEVQLRSELQKAMKEGGPVQAVSVCGNISASLAQVGSTAGMQLKRVTDKPRNPGNKADAYEMTVFAEWKNLIGGGHNPGLHMGEDEGRLRIMKPIRIQAQCLACHGPAASMSKELKDALAEKYPEDQATDYALNELRGAFSAIFAPQ